MPTQAAAQHCPALHTAARRWSLLAARPATTPTGRVDHQAASKQQQEAEFVVAGARKRIVVVLVVVAPHRVELARASTFVSLCSLVYNWVADVDLL